MAANTNTMGKFLKIDEVGEIHQAVSQPPVVFEHKTGHEIKLIQDMKDFQEELNQSLCTLDKRGTGGSYVDLPRELRIGNNDPNTLIEIAWLRNPRITLTLFHFIHFGPVESPFICTNIKEIMLLLCQKAAVGDAVCLLYHIIKSQLKDMQSQYLLNFVSTLSPAEEDTCSEVLLITALLVESLRISEQPFWERKGTYEFLEILLKRGHSPSRLDVNLPRFYAALFIKREEFIKEEERWHTHYDYFHSMIRQFPAHIHHSDRRRNDLLSYVIHQNLSDKNELFRLLFTMGLNPLGEQSLSRDKYSYLSFFSWLLNQAHYFPYHDKQEIDRYKRREIDQYMDAFISLCKVGGGLILGNKRIQGESVTHFQDGYIKNIAQWFNKCGIARDNPFPSNSKTLMEKEIILIAQKPIKDTMVPAVAVAAPLTATQNQESKSTVELVFIFGLNELDDVLSGKNKEVVIPEEQLKVLVHNVMAAREKDIHPRVKEIFLRNRTRLERILKNPDLFKNAQMESKDQSEIFFAKFRRHLAAAEVADNEEGWGVVLPSRVHNFTSADNHLRRLAGNNGESVRSDIAAFEPWLEHHFVDALLLLAEKNAELEFFALLAKQQAKLGDESFVKFILNHFMNFRMDPQEIADRCINLVVFYGIRTLLVNIVTGLFRSIQKPPFLGRNRNSPLIELGITLKKPCIAQTKPRGDFVDNFDENLKIRIAINQQKSDAARSLTNLILECSRNPEFRDRLFPALDVNYQNSYGDFALLYYVAAGFFEYYANSKCYESFSQKDLDLFLSHGANLFLQNVKGIHILNQVLIEGHRGILHALLARGLGLIKPDKRFFIRGLFYDDIIVDPIKGMRGSLDFLKGRTNTTTNTIIGANVMGGNVVISTLHSEMNRAPLSFVTNAVVFPDPAQEPTFSRAYGELESKSIMDLEMAAKLFNETTQNPHPVDPKKPLYKGNPHFTPLFLKQLCINILRANTLVDPNVKAKLFHYLMSASQIFHEVLRTQGLSLSSRVIDLIADYIDLLPSDAIQFLDEQPKKEEEQKRQLEQKALADEPRVVDFMCIPLGPTRGRCLMFETIRPAEFVRMMHQDWHAVDLGSSKFISPDSLSYAMEKMDDASSIDQEKMQNYINYGVLNRAKSYCSLIEDGSLVSLLKKCIDFKKYNFLRMMLAVIDKNDKELDSVFERARSSEDMLALEILLEAGCCIEGMYVVDGRHHSLLQQWNFAMKLGRIKEFAELLRQRRIPLIKSYSNPRLSLEDFENWEKYEGFSQWSVAVFSELVHTVQDITKYFHMSVEDILHRIIFPRTFRDCRAYLNILFEYNDTLAVPYAAISLVRAILDKDWSTVKNLLKLFIMDAGEVDGYINRDNFPLYRVLERCAELGQCTTEFYEISRDWMEELIRVKKAAAEAQRQMDAFNNASMSWYSRLMSLEVGKEFQNRRENKDSKEEAEIIDLSCSRINAAAVHRHDFGQHSRGLQIQFYETLAQIKPLLTVEVPSTHAAAAAGANTLTAFQDHGLRHFQQAAVTVNNVQGGVAPAVLNTHAGPGPALTPVQAAGAGAGAGASARAMVVNSASLLSARSGAHPKHETKRPRTAPGAAAAARATTQTGRRAAQLPAAAAAAAAAGAAATNNLTGYQRHLQRMEEARRQKQAKAACVRWPGR